MYLTHKFPTIHSGSTSDDNLFDFIEIGPTESC